MHQCVNVKPYQLNAFTYVACLIITDILIYKLYLKIVAIMNMA